jgi:ubiquitin-protein ligase
LVDVSQQGGLSSAFTMSSLFSQHHFLDDPLEVTNPSLFNKRLMRELKLLRDHCANADSPISTILVKSSEDLRLMKFAIVGPLHTPYYQSFFAFDLACFGDFPLAPPSVHHHSYGLRLNPNLYDDGHICLSLLGTWSGFHACERWNPAQSSIVQVILSIQSLVLVKEPYYNEAGYDEYRGTPHGRSASKQYNEQIALVRMQHMIAMARNPPADWVYEFRQHFNHVAPFIVRRMRALIDQEANRPEDERQRQLGRVTADGLVLPLTKGFVESLRRVLLLLEETHGELTQQWRKEEQDFSLDHE